MREIRSRWASLIHRLGRKRVGQARTIKPEKKGKGTSQKCNLVLSEGWKETFNTAGAEPKKRERPLSGRQRRRKPKVRHRK